MWAVSSLLAPKRRTRRTPGRAVRPRVEALEDRCCPAIHGGTLEWADPDKNISYGTSDVAIYPAGTANAGKIVGVGSGFSNNHASGYSVSVIRLTADGTFDKSFNGGGSEFLSVGAAAFGSTVAVQPDGKILVGGTAYATNKDYQTHTQDEFLVARLNPDGSLDKTFANRGVFTWDASPGRDEVYKLAVLADGSIVASGWSYQPGGMGLAVLKLTKAGTPASSFGSGGLTVFKPYGDAVNFALGHNMAVHAGGLAVAPNGDLILSARDDTRAAGLLVAVSASTGRPDTAFNGQGFLEAVPAGYGGAWFNAVAVQGNNVVVAGTAADNGHPVTGLVARFSLTGVLDTTFGTGGYYLTAGAVPPAQFTNVALEADGSIVVAGTYLSGTDAYGGDVFNGFVGHLTAGGQLDTSFGSSGTGYAPLPDGVADLGALAIDPLTGDIVVGGQYASAEYFFARLTHP